MSLYNQTVSNTPLSLDGLVTGDFNNITIDGFPFDPKNVVPYTGATKSVNLNNRQLTNVSLIDTNTLKINTVAAGTTAKYLATDSSGNVIEADITTKYVPYTGATAHVNLNAKNLSNVLTYSGTNVQVTSTETTSLLATGLAQLGSLRITSVPAGTQTNLLAVDVTGNVIVGTAPASTQLNLSPTTSPTLYYFPFISSNSAGVQTVYTDNAVIALTYDTGTKTLSPYQLKIQNVPAGTQTSLLAIDSAGNVIQGTSTPPTTLLTTQTGLVQTYYPTFVTTNTTGNKSYFVPYPQTGGYNITYTTTGVLGDVGTLSIPQMISDISMVCNGSVQLTGLSTVAPTFALGINASNQVVKFSAGSPNVTVTSTNSNFYPVFVNSAVSSGIKDLYQDSVAGDFSYNPSTNLLTVSNLTVSGTTTISGYAPLASPAFTGTPTAPTAAPFTNTTQIATTAFVLSALGSSPFLPLSGGVMVGTISFASGTNNLLQMYENKFVQYTNHISDTAGNNYISITTDAPSASPMPVAGFIVLNRNVSCSSGIITSGNASFGGTTTSTGRITGNNGLTITAAGSTYANIGVGGVNNIYADTQFYSSGGANAVMQVSYGTGVNQNIASTASYNWQTTSGGTGTTRLNIDVNRVKVSTIELAVSSTSYGQVRMIFDETGYGTFWRNDNGAFYLLITANGDPYGIWNALRPFYIVLSTGRLHSLNGQTFQGGTDTDYVTFQNGLGLTTASGATYGNVSLYGTGINSWTGYDLGKRWTLMYNGNECGFHDKNYTWQWRVINNTYYLTCPTIILEQVPQQTYQPYQVLSGSNGGNLQWGVIYSSYYQNNTISWAGGVLVATFFKASAISVLRCSGAVSYYIPSGGMYATTINFYNSDIGASYITTINQYTNNTYNHVSYPIMAQRIGLPTGNYGIYVSCNGITDGNDHIYLLSEICVG